VTIFGFQDMNPFTSSRGLEVENCEVMIPPQEECGLKIRFW
jgi:hypothetical protein